MSKFKLRDLVRVRATKMLGTVLWIGEGKVCVVIGSRPALDIARWTEELKKDKRAKVPGWIYAEGELDRFGPKP
jgi:hypothetical protein